MVKENIFNRLACKVSYNYLLLKKYATQTVYSVKKYNIHKYTVFVAGVQRSGTNMVMDVLERSYATNVYHESDERAYDHYEMRQRETLRSLARGSKAAVVVFKALCELQELRCLLNEFTPARGVWIVRNYEDVVNSHLVLWTGMPHSVGQIVQDRNAAGWRGCGMSDATHALVRKLYHPNITNASACALFWYFRNVLFFEQDLDQDERMCLVRYESLVTEPEVQFSRLFDFFGIEYAPRISAKVFASSVRKGPLPDIEPAIREVCEDLAERFDTLITHR